MERSAQRFRRYAWAVLVYNLGVVAWGAYVRATGSGAGCGNHWPLCNGEVVPRAPSAATLIELAHRLSSGLDGLLVLGLLVWAWRVFPPGHRVRRAAAAAFGFLVAEALIGAGLVRFELVAGNTSGWRAVVISIHLINTFLLLAWLALTADRAGERPADAAGAGGAGSVAPAAGRRLPPTTTWPLAGGLAGVLVLGISGAVAALGDTLFPVSSFRQGWAQDLSPTAHLFVRLRAWHPAIALALGLYLTAAALWLARRRPAARVRRRAAALAWLFVVQLAAGFVNLALAAPVWMQLVHLLLADLVWLALVLLSEEAVRPAGGSHPGAASAG